MKREDFLRELDVTGREMRSGAKDLAAAANPINQLKHGVARDWKWWLPGASFAGFAVARWLRRPACPKPRLREGREAPAGGAMFWVPLLLKVLPGALTQLVPLFLSLRSDRNR